MKRRSGFAAVLLLLATVMFAGAGGAAYAEGPAGVKVNAQPVICIDPGHQKHANNEPEPIGPGATETKPKVSSGTQGVVTRKPEYELTLETSLRMKEKLEALGYRVVLTRDEHDVDLSNRERAAVAEQAGAALFLRIHADGDASSRTQGISVLYPSADSPYTKAIYKDSRTAAGFLLDSLISSTGARSRGSVPRGDLTGFNWSTMPTVLVEMGFMTNPEEDVRLSEPGYQEKLAQGIAEGVDAYFRAASAREEVQPMDADVTLVKEAQLYERTEDDAEADYAASGTAVSAQVVHATARAGSWYRIDTWLGDRWVYAPVLIPGAVQAVDRLVALRDTTTMYAHPFADSAALGALAPQAVDAFEEYEGWYHIHSWLGDVWVWAGA